MRYLLTIILAILLISPVETSADVETITIFDSAPVALDRTAPEIQQFDGYMTSKHGQIIETSAQLPKASTNHRDTKRIVAVMEMEPVIVEETDKRRIADPWTRIGSVSILVPDPTSDQMLEIELVRFATGFGGKCIFEQDVTAFGSILHEEKIDKNYKVVTNAGGEILERFRQQRGQFNNTLYNDLKMDDKGKLNGEYH